MYHHQCDWCGKRIDTRREQYVRAEVEIVTHEKDHLGRRQNETEPTRFFHVTPLRSWIREAVAAFLAQPHRTAAGDA